MSDFDDWLTSNGKCRETASDLDEIQWLRLERQRLRKSMLSDEERRAVERAAETLRFLQADYGKTQTEQDACTLLALLERLS